MGRRLESALRSDGTEISYTYNADGLRTSKTIRNIKFNYYWNGDKLTAQTCGDNAWYFRYDGDTPIGFEYNGKEYYYVTNLQGDIIAILNSDGECVAEYTYDAWGNCTVTKDTEYIASVNPPRYRGYYFDSDTGLYYLQSRYYDSKTGRFVNADSADMISEAVFNLFEYCGCNPVMYVDKDGYYRAYVFSNREFFNESKYIRDSLNRYFKNSRTCTLLKMDYTKTFIKHWNSIKSADVIVINAHSWPIEIFEDLGRKKIREKLKKINCKALIILGCNAGHYNYIWNNVAYEFSMKITGTVVASDGTVYSDKINSYNSKNNYEPSFESVADSGKYRYRYWIPGKDKSRKNWGWVLYKSVYGKKYITTTWYSTNLYTITIPSILNYLKACGFVKF